MVARFLACSRVVYPSITVLAEVGPVTVAGSRLDLWMGFLWAPRSRNGRGQGSAGARLSPAGARAQARPGRLFGDLRPAVLAAVDVADEARKSRIVHQDWVLRGLDAT